jgi:hypothetical protein
MRAVRRLAGLVAVVIAGLAAAPAHAALPPIKHVFVIWMENKDYADTFAKDNPQAPYLAKTLPAMGAHLPEYYAIGHLSLGNYVAVVSGQGPNPQTQSDCQIFSDFLPGAEGPDGQSMGSGCVYPASVKTIANQLEDKRLKWKGYMEDMALGDPKSCRHPALNQHDGTQTATAGDQYAARHNPFVYFHSIIDGPTCAANDVDLSQMPADIASAATTASYSFITPDLCSDGHDAPCVDGKRPGGLKSIDAFLQEWVPRIMESPGFKDDGLLVVSFDEAEHDSSACCNERAANTPSAGGDSPGPGGGKVGAVLISPFIKPGTIDSTPYNHYSFLRTTEDIFGLPHLGYAAMDGLAPIGDKTFNQTPKLDLKVTALRVNRTHVRFAVDAGRAATVSFGGVCSGAPSQPTSEDGKLTTTVRHSRGGSCRVTVSRDAWQSSAKSFKLRAPRRQQ